MGHNHIFVDDLKGGIEGDVRFDSLSRMLYRTDASIYEIEPRGVVVPRNRADVVHLLRVAAESRVPILPRGGGTSLAGQSVGDAIHLDFSKYMNQILELNTDERWVRVEPGVVLDELNAFLKPHGLQFGPDVATSSRANIGGMIGNNSCGAHSIIWGKTIDHTLELSVVLADGSQAILRPVSDSERSACESQDNLEGSIYRAMREILHTYDGEIRARFPKVMRRVSGYNLDALIDLDGESRPFDLSKLVVGSEGTLCSVAEARLNLVEVPAFTAVVACHFDELIESLRANVEIALTAPASVELVDKILLDQTKGSLEHAGSRHFLQGDPEAVLFVEYYADSRDELEEKLEGLEARLRRKGFGYTNVRAMETADQRNMWELRKAGLGLLMGMKGDAKPQPGVEDTCVPIDDLPEYVERVQALTSEHGVLTEFYGHASVGLLHIRPILNLKRADGIRLLRLFEERMSDMVLEYGGSMSGEHGDGLARSEWIEKMFGAELTGAFASVKASFDPQDIMNPGKIVRPPRMDESLRYGSDYAEAAQETFFSFDKEGGFQQAAEMCSGVGQCRKKLVGTMCPSYIATLEEEHSTRGRANALRAALSGRLSGDGLASDDLHEVMDLCLECKACKSECPSNVDMAKLKYEFLAHYHEHHGFSLRQRLFAGVNRLNRVLSPVAPLANLIVRSAPHRWLLDRFLGIDQRRRMPRLASRTFSSWFRKHRPEADRAVRGTVVLFNDTFTEYNDPQIGMAATAVLESAGFRVIIPESRLCCGRPLISKGFLKQAKERAIQNVESLVEYARRGWHIVGLEPSCLLTFSDDYVDLVNNTAARTVAANVSMLEDFLYSLAQRGELNIAFSDARREVLFHGHCHQKALVGTESTMALLNMPANFSAREIPSGCCGMAGSFGYEKEHYDISMKIGKERLFDVIDDSDSDTIIAATGTSCRHQIADATSRRARHWVEILAEAL